MLDSLAPYYEKRIPTLNPPDPRTNPSGTENQVKTRTPSYENPNAVKGTDGVIYRAAGPRGKGAKVSTVPIVAPTVVKPGCVTTATLPPPPKKEKDDPKKEPKNESSQNVKAELRTPARNNNVGTNNDQLLAEIRAKFPNANGPSIVHTPPNQNNNVMTQVQKKMVGNGSELKSNVLKDEPAVTSPESQVKKRILYDPKPRRGRPIDLPDQTMILKTPKVENPHNPHTPSTMDRVRAFVPNFND